MKILITSGGTMEYIDDVRVMTNISTGALGCVIAETFLEHGHKVMYVHGRNAKVPDPHKNLSMAIVTSAQDAYDALKVLVPVHDAVIHAMAVSDFTFKRDIVLKCKSSDPEAFIDYMRRSITKNPKIIGEIKKWNPNVMLVGFKFEVGIQHEELIALAQESISKNGCDLVVANDKVEMKENKAHVAYIVPSMFLGDFPNQWRAMGKEAIAKELLDIMELVWQKNILI